MFNAMDAMCGGRHESYMEECKDTIESKDIVKFSYLGTDYMVSATKEGEDTESSENQD